MSNSHRARNAMLLTSNIAAPDLAHDVDFDFMTALSGNYVLIVDDDEALCALLVDYFSRFAISAQWVGNADAAWQTLRRLPPSLIILDVMLPGMDGFALCRKIRERSPVPIIMLTARGELTDRVVGLELGADDYLSKPFEPRELVARVQAVLRRGASTDPVAREPLHVGELEIHWTRRLVKRSGESVPLTSAEFELLALLIRHRGQVLSRDRIMDETRGVDWAAYDRSIDVLISRVRQKLGDDVGQQSLIRTVRGTGYSFTGGAEE